MIKKKGTFEVTLTPGWKSGAGPEGQKSEGGLSSRRSPNFTGSYSPPTPHANPRRLGHGGRRETQGGSAF